MNKPTDQQEWHQLSQHQQEINDQHMRHWFEADSERFKRFHVSVPGILLDYSRNRITEKTLPLLCQLAETMQLRQQIAALFSGQPINHTENRSVLHVALRDPTHEPIFVRGEDIKPQIAKTRERLQALVNRIHQQEWLGATGKPIKHIVNIGIGGSYLGPKLCTEALKEFAVCDLDFHYVSTIDKVLLNDTLAKINLEQTLFIFSYKTFTTIETMTNANSAATLIKNKFGTEAIAQHFIAVTTAVKKAVEFGIPAEQIFPMWDWVGGRYSVWSPIGLPLMLMIGNVQFAEFLAGAHTMDQHFQTAPWTENLPVIMALLGIWYANFFAASVQAIIPYAHRLRYLVPYLQQAEMESNGKCFNHQGDALTYQTSPIVFGEEGCNGQHTYHQLLHQGTRLVPADFILIGQTAADAGDIHQDILIASGLSQAQALMRGKTYHEAHEELLANGYDAEQAALLAHHRIIPGNRPSNVLFLEKLTPRSLGSLLALYEHKIFVQGVIWQINSFDQWGVELGKQLLPGILQQVNQHDSATSLDSATLGLIEYFRSLR